MDEQLTDTERAILAIERLQWKYLGLKEARVREDLDLSMTAYTQLLNAMLSDPRVEAADPLTIRRLRRVRNARLSVGAGRRLG